jgi:hypothetical protein
MPLSTVAASTPNATVKTSGGTGIRIGDWWVMARGLALGRKTLTD